MAARRRRWRPRHRHGPALRPLQSGQSEVQHHRLADRRGGDQALAILSSRGDTETEAAYLQDVWTLDPNLKLTTGARVEHWQALNGFNFSQSPALSVNQPALSATRTSPKASLEWTPGGNHWRLTASYGDAYRFPTVTELYQAVTTGAILSVPNPNLKPEHARSAEARRRQVVWTTAPACGCRCSTRTSATP